MKEERGVVLDACVLIPMPLADTLLRLGSGQRLYLPRWSDQIMQEVSRTLVEKFSLSEAKAQYREREIRRHFPEAWVVGYEKLISSMTNHPKDRHVLAACVHGKAAMIVTYNIKDFPRSSLEPFSIKVQGPSAFLKDLYDLAPSAVMQVLETQAADIGQTLEYLLTRLRVNVPAFIETIEKTS